MVMDVMYGPLPADLTTVALEAPDQLSIGGLQVAPVDG